MNHLSEQEVFDYADGRPSASSDDASRHFAECAQCRAAVALHRRIRSTASHADGQLLSKNFTSQVLRKVVRPNAAPRFSWLMENSANIFAMAFVVAVVATIIYVVAQSSPDAGDSVYARQFSLWHDAYASIMNALSARNKEAVLPVVSDAKGFFNSIFFMGIGVLLLLGSLDKLRIFSRIFKSR